MCVYIFSHMISIMCLLEWFCPMMVVAQLVGQYFETLKIQLEKYIAMSMWTTCYVILLSATGHIKFHMQTACILKPSSWSQSTHLINFSIIHTFLKTNYFLYLNSNRHIEGRVKDSISTFRYVKRMFYILQWNIVFNNNAHRGRIFLNFSRVFF